MLQKINGIDINYEEMGNGFPTVFLHGWGANIQSWGNIPKALSDSFKCIVIDFPGFGQSGFPPGTYTVNDYANIVIELMDKLSIDKFNIVCHSFGGRVSIILANRFGDRINKMVFTDAAGVKPRRGFKYYAKVYKYKLAKKMYKNNFVKTCVKALGIDVEKIVKNAGSSDYKNLNQDMKKVFVSVVNEDLTGLLCNISCPTLLIWGDEDKDTPMYMAKTMEEKIKDSGLVVFEGAGHFSYLSDIPRYIKIVRVFFGG